MSEQQNNSGSGLHINKKTIIGVTSILLGIMIFAGILTQVVPAGQYAVDDNGVIINGTYERVEADYSFWRVLIAPAEAFVKDFSSAVTGLAIILFIVLIGGTFLLLDKSGVLKYIMTSIVGKFSSRKYKLLPLIVLACMAMSSFAGILEESITLVPLAVAISLALGWDSLVGISMSLISVGLGYAAATFNPFNVVVVQSMSEELTLFSGTLFRLLVFAVVYGVFLAVLMPYAKKIEKNPKKSIVYDNDLELRERFLSDRDGDVNPNLGRATKNFLVCISGVLAVTVIVFIARNFVKNEALSEYMSYLPMVAMVILFTIGGMRAGSVAGMKRKEIGKGFWEGAKAVLPCAPMIIFIISITYILKAGKIIDTILHAIYSVIGDFSPYAAILMIFLVILVLEFFIGSGTAKAFLVMPLMLPLATMCGVTHQSVTLAFCLSDGFGNLMFPTSGVMLIAIGLINVSYGKYMRFFWRILIPELIAGVAMLLLAVFIGYN